MHIFHFFVPHKKNNHRAKILHNISLFVLIISVALVSSFSIVVYRTHPEVLGVSYQITDVELLNLTNYERVQEGLAPLSFNSRLATAAQKKGQHMFEHNYWAHFGPDGASPWDFIRGEGYNYTYAGENLAKGFTTSYDAVKAWMKSPTHRANILSPNYTEVGFSISEGRLQNEDTVLIVQEFGARADGIVEISPDQPVAQVQGSSNEKLPKELSTTLVKKPMFNLTAFAKGVTMILLSALLIALVLDFIIIEKKKIPRVVGNNLDHIMLISIFLAFLFMARVGHII